MCGGASVGMTLSNEEVKFDSPFSRKKDSCFGRVENSTYVSDALSGSKD